VASFVEAVCTAIYDALDDDEPLATLLGTSGKIIRAHQATRVEPPHIIIEPPEQEPLAEGTADVRQARLAVHCYHTTDFKASELADAVVNRLQEATDLLALGYVLYVSWLVGAFGQPIWSQPEQAFRVDCWFAINTLKS